MSQTNIPPKKGSKNYFIVVTIITLIFVAAGLLFWFRYLRPEEKGSVSSPFPQINLEDASINNILKPEVSLFESCLRADDIEDYESKKANTIIGDFKSLTIPEFIKFPVELYSVPVKTTFEIETNDTILLFNKTFCELTSANWQALVSPLYLEDIVDYITLRNINLSSIPKNTSLITLLSGEDYIDYDNASSDDNEKTEPREVTTVTEEVDRFVVRWVYYHPDDLEITTKDIIVLKNGLIP